MREREAPVSRAAVTVENERNGVWIAIIPNGIEPLLCYDSLPAPEAGDVIGVDDFAYRKRHTYGTIIVDERTHGPIALLDGRDGDTLRGWLRHHKNVKVVTRDRASAYAKVIEEELPDAMQVADRFHLHQNLLEAVKKALNQELPATIDIPHADGSTGPERTCKKNRINCG